MENSMEILRKIKNKSCHSLQQLHLCIYPEKINTLQGKPPRTAEVLQSKVRVSRTDRGGLFITLRPHPSNPPLQNFPLEIHPCDGMNLT